MEEINFSQQAACLQALNEASLAEKQSTRIKNLAAVGGWGLSVVLAFAVAALAPLKEPVAFAFERSNDQLRFVGRVDPNSGVLGDDNLLIAQLSEFVQRKEEYSCFAFQANFTTVYTWMDGNLATAFAADAKRPDHVFNKNECSIAYQIHVDSSDFIDGEKADLKKTITGPDKQPIRTALINYTRAQVDPTSGRVQSSDRFKVRVSFYRTKVGGNEIRINPLGIKVAGYAREELGAK